MKRSLLLTAILIMVFLIEPLAIVNLADANPFLKYRKPSFPTFTVLSPIENSSYPSDDVWFTFTIVKPEDWLGVQYRGQIINVPYKIDDTDNRWGSPNQTKVDIQDPLDAVNPPSTFNLSVPLEGLQAGEHTFEAMVYGYVNQSGVHVGMMRINFTVYDPEAESSSIPSTTNSTVYVPEAELNTQPSTMTYTYLVIIFMVTASIIFGIFLVKNYKKCITVECDS